MKNFAAFSNPFISDEKNTTNLYNLVSSIESCNGFYICTNPTLELSGIGVNSLQPNRVVTWFDSLAGGNYLSIDNNINTQSPTLILNDTQFNNKNSIDFNNDSSNKMRFKRPIAVRTIFIVYLIRETNSYLFFAPRTASSQNGTIFHDAFPPDGDKLWFNELRSNSSVYNAINRINGKQVDSNVFTPLNAARVLTITNIDNQGLAETISGIGGRSGARGGTLSGVNRADSVKGKIACIITFENNLSLEQIQEIENELITLFIDYNGAVASSIPTFKSLQGNTLNYDFKTIILDEFFDITEYELLQPLDVGLSLSNQGVLSGTVNALYNGGLKIKVTNSNGISKEFSFILEICQPDPIVNNLYKDSIVSVLSANTLYGLKVNSNNEVLIWEDARRVKNVTDIQPTLPYYEYIPSTSQKTHNFISPKLESNSVNLFNGNTYSRFYANSKLDVNNSFVKPIIGNDLKAKSFAWVYIQTEGGNRNFLNSFPDIKGTGELWTVANNTQVHGQDRVTSLNTQVNKLEVNTLSYKLEKNKFYIVIATGTEDITFSNLINLKGYLALFCSWSITLTPTQVRDVIKTLSTRFYESDYPLIVSQGTEFRSQSNIVIDLTKHVVDLKDKTLSYSIVTNHRNAVINNNTHQLSFVTTKDEVLTFVINVTNSLGLTTVLNLTVDITIKTNKLYLDIKNLIGTSNINAFYILENESIDVTSNQLTQWRDYRETGEFLIGNNTFITSLPYLDNKNAVDFNIDGSSSLSISDNVISGKAFIFGYVRKNNTIDKAFLLGQDADTSFASGDAGVFLDASLTSSSILNSTNYINGYSASNNYLIGSSLLNTVIINSNSNISFNTIAKDRVFTDRSVKGFIPFICVLNINVSNTQAFNINKAIRDYYDSAKFITLLHLNNSVADDSVLSKTVTVSSNNVSSIYETSVKKFGTSSFALVNNSQCNRLSINNNSSFAFLYEDFTISFWVSLNKHILNTETLNLFTFSNLLLFIRGNQLVLARNLVTPLYSVVLNSSLYNQDFQHIEIVRKNKTLYIFINGMLINNTQPVIDNIEYVDAQSPFTMGEFKTLSTTGIFYYIDELAILRRNALHTNNFILSNSEYVII